MRLAPGLLAAAWSVLTAIACSSANAVEDKVCEAGKEYYCRCKNLDEGSQICRADGMGYDACEPCYDDYETDGDYGFPEDDEDAGSDAKSDAPRPGCGNRQVDPGESCDDGNSDPDDGCDRCVAGGNPRTGTACPGITVHLWDEPFEISGTTANAGNAHTGLECDGETGGNSPDRVYTLIPHRTGTLRIERVEADFNAVLYTRPTCDDPLSQTACSRDQSAMTVTVDTAEEPVVVTVDGAGTGAKGTYTLRFTP